MLGKCFEDQVRANVAARLMMEVQDPTHTRNGNKNSIKADKETSLASLCRAVKSSAGETQFKDFNSYLE